MRLALIAAAGAKPSPAPLLGERDASLMASRLGLDDLGFEVVVLDPNLDLAEQLDQALAAHEGSIEALLFYASCLLAVVDDTDCFLCLDPEEPDVGDALADVAEVLGAARAPQTLLVLELRYDEPGVTRAVLGGVLDAVAASIEPDWSGLELIAAVRPIDAHPERIPSRLTAALLEHIDDSEGELAARRAYAAAIQSADFGTWPHAVGHRSGASAFLLRPGPVGRTISAADETPRDQLETEERASATTMPAAAPATAAPPTTVPPETVPPETEPIPPTAPSVGVAPITSTVPDGSFSLTDAQAGREPGLGADDDATPEAPASTPAPSTPEPPAAPEPPAPEPPPPSLPASSGRRPPPISERKESTSISWPSKRGRSEPASQPKVVIGAAASSPGSARPLPSDPSPASSSDPVPPSSPPDRSPSGRPISDRPRALMQTSADGPAAKRLSDAARRAIAEATDEGVKLPFLDSDRTNGSPAPAALSPERVLNRDDVEITVDDEVSVDDEISADVEISVEAEVVVSKKSSAPPPPSLRKKVADMTVADHIEAGDLARRLGHDDEAVSHYKKGLAKLGTTQTPDRATIYVRIGELMKKGGKVRLAVSNFDKALQIVPGQRAALQNLVELEIAQENWRNVGVLEDRLLSSVEGEERLTMLLASGDRWRDRARDRRRAKERYEEARAAFAKQIPPLERLLALYEDDGSIDHALDMRRRIADLIADPRERARYYFDIGEKCLFDLGREDEGYGAFELALDADPTMLEALEVLASALAEGQEWGELERVYAKMIDKFSSRQRDEATLTVLTELHHRSALLFRDHLDDPASALQAVDRELELRPSSLSAQLMAAELAREIGEGQRALEHLRQAARLVPHRAETYHQIFELGQRYEAPEIAYLASAVVQVIGGADDRERIIYREHQPRGAPSHVSSLDDEAWHWLLAEREPAVDAVMCAIAPAVLRLRVRELEAEGKLPELPAEARQDIERSTLSMVRSIGWASQFLGIAAPAIYILDEAPAPRSSPLWAPLAREQSTVVARDATRGRTVGELAFLAGRHLAMRLPEHELVAHLTSVDELTACFLAAIRVVLGTAPASGEVATAAQTLAPLLDGQLSADERASLVEAVEAFSAAGGRVNLRAWVASVERSATRAGLVLCGDLETAVQVIREEGDSALSTVAERLEDLLAYTVSKEHARVRQALGSGLEPKGQPPALSAVL